MTPRLDILPAEQRALWPALTDVPWRFVLYDGTAVALRLGHRVSVDFDFFASAPLDLDQLLAALPWLRGAMILRQEPQAFTCLHEGQGAPVMLSFFGNLRLGRVAAPERTGDGVMSVASALDLLGHKLKVILQRAEGKDYQDIAALLASGLTLPDGLAAAAALFEGFPIMESVRALGYRGDVAEPERIGPAEAAVLDTAIRGLPAHMPARGGVVSDLASE